MRFSTLTNRIAGEGASAWDIHVRALKRRAAGEDITVLSVGDPDFITPASIIEAAKRSLDDGATHYADVQGKRPLRDAIAQRYCAAGTDTHADNLIVMAGAQCGLYAVAQCLLEAGDEVIIPEPSYVTYEAVIQAPGAVIKHVPLQGDNGFCLDVADIAAAITPRTRAILLNSPHNPTGTLIDAKQWNDIAALCREHDLWLISDEVYAELIFDGQHFCAASLPDMAERTVVISSLSKSHAMTGWRVGWVRGPETLINHLSNLALCMLYGCPDFIQDAAIVALSDDLQTDIDVMREAYRERRDAVCQALSGCSAVEVITPQAGMFVMVDIRATGLSSQQFADRLLDEHAVSVLSGEAFGPSASGFVRLSLTVSPLILSEACLRLVTLAEQVRPDSSRVSDGSARTRQATQQVTPDIPVIHP